MLLGHGAIGQFGVAEALPGTVVNAGTVDVSMGQAATFSIGTETVAASAVFAVTTGMVFPRFSRLFKGRKRTHTLTADEVAITFSFSFCLQLIKCL